MTPQQIYDLTPIETPSDLGGLGVDLIGIYSEGDNSTGQRHLYGVDAPRVDYRVYYYESLGSSGVFELSSLWFDGKPVLILDLALDTKNKFVTDKPLYTEMIAYLRGLLGYDEFASEGVAINEPIATSFVLIDGVVEVDMPKTFRQRVNVDYGSSNNDGFVMASYPM